MIEGFLSVDEYDALAQIKKSSRYGRPSACVARNSKRLVGLKYIAHQKDGSFMLTDKGKQTLFVKACVEGLRALASDPLAPIDSDVATFLGKKGHVVANADGPGHTLTQRGAESLADIVRNEAAAKAR
ncbi:MAG: hypothetical protein ACRYGK_14695 [Janthinobacterium lividum]